MKKLDHVQDWSAPSMLYLLERYNGLGYRKRGLPSPSGRNMRPAAIQRP